MNKNSQHEETPMAGLFHPGEILKAGRTDYLCDLDLTNDELYYLLDLAAAVKQSPREYGQSMAGKSIAMLFEKPSLRTKLTFDLAMTQMGGASVFMEGPIGVREPLKDVARNLDRWCNGIVARVFAQTTVEGLAQWSKVPVINALSDAFHPCQALADVLTVRERFGTLKGLKLTFIGDGNNVAQSLMLTAVRLGMDFALGCPPGYTPDPDIVSQAEGLAATSGATILITHDAAEALAGAHAVYTDVWASMGQEQEAAKRKKAFHVYQVNEELFAQALPVAVFMHCLPAKRGEEVTDGVMESPRSVVFEQAENRLHAQKALLLMMLT
jgi:ornithine carbamoyltransferase